MRSQELGREWETLVREVFLEEGGQSRDWKEGRDTSKGRDRKSSAASVLPQTGYSNVSSECLPCQVWLAFLPQLGKDEENVTC